MRWGEPATRPNGSSRDKELSLHETEGGGGFPFRRIEIQDAWGPGSRAATARLPPVAHRRVPEARQIPGERRGKGSRSIILFLKREPLGLLISRETSEPATALTVAAAR